MHSLPHFIKNLKWLKKTDIIKPNHWNKQKVMTKEIYKNRKKLEYRSIGKQHRFHFSYYLLKPCTRSLELFLQTFSPHGRYRKSDLYATGVKEREY